MPGRNAKGRLVHARNDLVAEYYSLGSLMDFGRILGVPLPGLPGRASNTASGCQRLDVPN